MSLLGRLCLLMLLAGLPAVSTQIWNEIALERAREAEIFEEAQRVAGQVTAELDRIVEGARQLLIAIAEAPAIKAADPAGCTEYLRNLAGRYPAYLLLAANAFDGAIICNARGDLLDLIARSVGPGVRIAADLPEGLPSVRADAKQL